MAQELQLTLTIIGILLIGGIFAHGIWSIRKNKEQLRDYKQPARSEPGLDTNSLNKDKDGLNKDGLDSHGVGKPRKLAGAERNEPAIDTAQSTPHSQEQRPTQPIEPTIDINEPPPEEASEPQIAEKPTADIEGEVEEQPDAVEPSEVLIIHVSMPDNKTISGASLLPMLISMGFKFGEMDIFHRHEDTAGVGPVLFSLASMYNPGTFDIDNMEQISTKGLSLFMTLPCHGEALQNFNMMHNAAKKVAEEFGGHILDSHRSAMTVQTVRHYVEKIREFERQQLING